MGEALPAYGLWLLVIVNAAVFIIFAFSFSRPQTARDWRSFGAFSAFIIALFTEMYGFPLTVYLLSGWLLRRHPSLDLSSHDAGHLWPALLGWSGNAHFSPFHLASQVLIFGGFVLLARAWSVLYAALRQGKIAMTGPYSYIRHPHYVAFMLIMLGFLLQWPTLPTVVMFPILVVMYVRLARHEEAEALATFGDAYVQYAGRTPAFVPLAQRATASDGEGRQG